MLETLRKRSRRAHIIWIIASVFIAVALLVWTRLAILNVITGPVEMDIEQDPAAYAGKYVTIDAEYFLTDYVEHTTTTTKKYGGSSTSVDGHSYIAFQSVPDYENGTSTWYFYSVYMKKSDQDMMYDLIDDTWDYWSDETGMVAPPKTLKVTGTWTEMEPKLEQYYRETLEEMGMEETEYDVFYFYNLDTSKIGGQAVEFFWVIMAAVLIAVLVFIYNLIGCFSNAYISKIHKYLQKDTNASMAAIEADFTQAHVIDKNTWLGRSWTIYIRGAKAEIVSNKELVWGYYYRRTGRNSVSEMRLYTVDKKLYHVSLSENETQTALQYYASEQPQMVLGYTKELEKSYQKNFAEFLEMKYNPAQRAASADAFYNV